MALRVNQGLAAAADSSRPYVPWTVNNWMWMARDGLEPSTIVHDVSCVELSVVNSCAHVLTIFSNKRAVMLSPGLEAKILASAWPRSRCLIT